MTTLAYHHKKRVIAVDGRLSMKGLIVQDNALKYAFRNDAHFFFTGKPSDYELLMDIYFGGPSNGKLPECQALMVRGTGGEVSFVSVNDDGIADVFILEQSFALGSGSDFATAALDFGKTAVEAVAYAATRDVYTGGTITLFDIDTLSFEPPTSCTTEKAGSKQEKKHV